jgi:hypothetical protein
MPGIQPKCDRAFPDFGANDKAARVKPMQPSALVIGSNQTTIAMTVGSRLSGAEFTFLAWLCPASGAADRQFLLLCQFHSNIYCL